CRSSRRRVAVDGGRGCGRRLVGCQQKPHAKRLGGSSAPEHRVHPDRRPRLEPGEEAVHAARSRPPAPSDHLQPLHHRRLAIPPGWSDWTGAGDAYAEFNYDLNENGRIVHYGGPPPPPARAANYLTDVLASRATRVINQAARAHRPFVMEVATFAPHRPYTP